MEAPQLYLATAPAATSRAAPTLLKALPFLPLAWLLVSLAFAAVRWLYRCRKQDGKEPGYFDVFIQEEHILAAMEIDGQEDPEQLTPAKLEALLPPPPIALLLIPLVEMVARVAMLVGLAIRGGAGVWARETLGASALATAWLYAFFAELRSRSRLPPWRHLVLFLLLFTSALVNFVEAFHTFRRSPRPHSNLDLLSTIPDVLACGALVLTIVAMPLRVPLGAVVRDSARDVQHHPQSPEDNNTLLGSLTYAWMNDIMALARRRPLTPFDVWSLSLSNRAEVLAGRWAMLTESTLVGKILHASARDVAIDFSLKLVAVGLNYLRPYWIQRVLESLTLASTSSTEPWSPHDQAYVHAFFAFLSMVARSLAELQHFHHARRIGMRLRSELTIAVYEKALRRKDLAGEVHHEGSDDKEEKEQSASAGKVVSLISDDTNRILRMGCDAHLIYGAPLEILLALGFLYSLMGWSALVGFTILVAAVPLNYKLGKRSLELSRQRSAARDRRQASLQELIAAIRTINFFGWSSAWTERVDARRNEELTWMVKEWLNTFLIGALWMLISITVPLLSFLSYVKLQHRDLTVATAFTSLSYFSMVRGPLNQIPDWGIRLLQVKISVARIAAFLGEEEVELHATPTHRAQDSRLVVKNATFRYSKGAEAVFELKDISLDFPDGKLTLISGPTGSGKTSLLLALLGELEVVKGEVKLPVAISYAPQHPWLESSSIRDSILFGTPYDPTRYSRTLDACALRRDLAELPAGDSTLIGERGVSLSGGQRARVALARALYAPSSLILLDDVLSAVDAPTGRHLFTEALTGSLVKGRTVILATHHNVLPGASYHVRLVEGRVDSQKVAEVVQVDEAQLHQVEEVCDGGEEPHKMETEQQEAPSAAAETWTTGAIRRSIYTTYLSASSYTFVGAHLLFVVARPVVSFLEQFWLRRWGEAAGGPRKVNVDYFLTGFGIINLASLVVFLVSILLLFAASLRAARQLFKRLLDSVVHATPRWFDITPVGRITNRFTNDISIVDGELAGNFSGFAGNVLSLMASLGVTSFVLPVAIAPTACFGIVYIVMFTRYLSVNRDLNRIAATTASPLFSGFHEVLVGITTIRAFGRERDYRRKVAEIIDRTLGIWYCSCTLDVWLSIRTQLLSGVTLLVTATCAIFQGISPGLAAIAISSSLLLIQYLDSLCSSYGRLVNSLNSLERITEYLELPQEREGGKHPPASWPSSACVGPMVEVKNLSIRYAPELEPALQDVSFSVMPGERVAIAGRTGSGKSTLAMSLLGFVDPCKGSITVDGLDITQVALEALRSRVTLLPQDAVLFSGTVRENLDPFGEHTDEDLTRALERTHLIISLGTPVAAGGANFSAGQKQLISLARALLRDSRLIIFDESTASLDTALDARIQRTVREEFTDATLITIAHRLRTIIDYSRVLVIDAGRVVEFDSPKALLEKEDGAFLKMCRESSDFEELLELAGVSRK